MSLVNNVLKRLDQEHRQAWDESALLGGAGGQVIESEPALTRFKMLGRLPWVLAGLAGLLALLAWVAWYQFNKLPEPRVGATSAPTMLSESLTEVAFGSGIEFADISTQLPALPVGEALPVHQAAKPMNAATEPHDSSSHHSPSRHSLKQNSSANNPPPTPSMRIDRYDPKTVFRRALTEFENQGGLAALSGLQDSVVNLSLDRSQQQRLLVALQQHLNVSQQQRWLRSLLHANPQLPLLRSSLAGLILQGDKSAEKARQVIALFQTDSPQDEAGLAWYALASKQVGAYDQAIALYQQLTAIAPEDWRWALGMAQCLEAIESTQAQAWYQRLLSLGPLPESVQQYAQQQINYGEL